MQPVTLLVGSYTQRLPHCDGKGRGIYSITFDPATQALSAPALVAAGRNPSYLARSGATVYAAHETSDYQGLGEGFITAFRDRGGALAVIDESRSFGAGPAHVALDPASNRLAVANYGSGTVAIYAIRDDGTLARNPAVIECRGSGPNLARQMGPHPHMALFDPLTGLVLVADLGDDSVRAIAIDGDGAVELDGRRLRLSPGSGPRHMVLSRDSRTLFVVAELSAAVEVFDRGSDGFVHRESISLRGPGERRNQPAAIRLSGGRIFVSNRGPDTISVMDASRGQCSVPVSYSTGGSEPRDFALINRGQHLVVANQNSDEIVAFRVEERGGILAETGRVSVPSPACVLPR